MRSYGSVYDRKNEEFGMKVTEDLTEDLLKDALRIWKGFYKIWEKRRSIFRSCGR